MTDAEISRRLALAIGWKRGDVRTSKDGRYITVPAGPFSMRRQFDYRDPTVIWPIAERFAAFPMRSAKGTGWVAITEDLWHSGSNYGLSGISCGKHRSRLKSLYGFSC